MKRSKQDVKNDLKRYFIYLGYLAVRIFTIVCMYDLIGQSHIPEYSLFNFSQSYKYLILNCHASKCLPF